LKIENSHMKVKNWSFPDCKLLADSKNVQLFEGQFQPLEVKEGKKIWNFQISPNFDQFQPVYNH
jgi:hypothetical protein